MRAMFTNRLAALLLICAASHAQTLNTLVNLNGSNGDGPDGGSLIWGADGNLYGAARSGGPGNYGVIFKVTPSGNLSMVNSFSSEAGPALGLLLANDGNFYGTTTLDGIFAGGTIYRLTPDGSYTVLYELSYYDGIVPNGGLIQGMDGFLYGTSYGNDAGGTATVFKMSLDGDFTVLHTFGDGEPQAPEGGLVQTSDGNFYGTGLLGGQSNRYGGVFKMAPDGTITTIYSFMASDGNGVNPDSALVVGADGCLYGTTGGDYTPAFPGTIFKILPDGTLTTLHTFIGTDGANPRHAALIQASDGNFYGTTYAGGAHGWGTIFSITPDGVFTKLYDFNFTDGRNPLGGLIQGRDGAFYGTTSSGGSSYRGTVFRFTVPGVGTAGGVMPTLAH
jgi:uncharacterized repeat protein (TIGR03803 family)